MSLFSNRFLTFYFAYLHCCSKVWGQKDFLKTFILLISKGAFKKIVKASNDPKKMHHFPHKYLFSIDNNNNNNDNVFEHQVSILGF